MWRRIGMDQEVFQKLSGKKVLIVNDEHFILTGEIRAVFNQSIAFFTDGKERYLSFNRILEIRLLEEYK